ncbi:MAG: DUF5681 domain-containing protein [Humidesulfovibrio sp.]|nr:DUF5681 domain-containing protein [Humidesulfovibrio sp.]
MAENAATKQRGRPFPKGVSGNPAGKPVGTRHKATRAALALLEGEGEALTRKAVEMALAGDTTALRLCLERIAPPAKDRALDPKAVELPDLLPENLAAASAAVLRAVVAGKLTPLEGASLAGLIEGHRKTTELVDLENRLAAVEAAQQEKHK